MWCDDCGDVAMAVKPIKVKFSDGSVFEILICLECWWQHFEGKSRKLQVARMLRILKDE
jgi:hypothetical protein